MAVTSMEMSFDETQKPATSSKLSLPWLLVASPQLMDPNFKKAVVLIVEHTPEGSMGFVINRPIETSLAELVDNAPVEIPPDVPGWYGGPVETGTGIILHNGQALKNQGDDPAPAIALSSTQETLVELVQFSERRLKELKDRPGGARQPVEPLYPFRFLVGYSGWGAGQLMDEIRSGAWLQLPASEDMVFNANWKTLWDQAMGKVGVNPKSFAVAEHSYLN